MKATILALIGFLFLVARVGAQKSDSSQSVPQHIRAAEVFDAQETLARLGYGTAFTAVIDDKTQEALRAYQQRNGLPVTGNLDAKTGQRLFKDKLAIATPSVLLPRYLFDDSNWNTFVWAKGIWVEQGKEPDANTPAISARVECLKAMSLCIAAKARVMSNTIDLVWFDIERWDEHEITTKPYDLPCGRESIRISREDKSVLEINTAAYKNVQACTKLFGPPTKPAVSLMVDGQKIADAQLRAFRAAQDRLLLIPPEAKLRLAWKAKRQD